MTSLIHDTTVTVIQEMWMKEAVSTTLSVLPSSVTAFVKVFVYYTSSPVCFMLVAKYFLLSSVKWKKELVYEMKRICVQLLFLGIWLLTERDHTNPSTLILKIKVLTSFALILFDLLKNIRL